MGKKEGGDMGSLRSPQLGSGERRVPVGWGSPLFPFPGKGGGEVGRPSSHLLVFYEEKKKGKGKRDPVHPAALFHSYLDRRRGGKTSFSF